MPEETETNGFDSEMSGDSETQIRTTREKT